MLAHQSGIYILEEEVDKYSLLYLQFMFSYCFNVVLAYNTLNTIHSMTMPLKHAWTMNLIINLLVQDYAWQHAHLFASWRRRMALS